MMIIDFILFGLLREIKRNSKHPKSVRRDFIRRQRYKLDSDYYVTQASTRQDEV